MTVLQTRDGAGLLFFLAANPLDCSPSRNASRVPTPTPSPNVRDRRWLVSGVSAPTSSPQQACNKITVTAMKRCASLWQRHRLTFRPLTLAQTQFPSLAPAAGLGQCRRHLRSKLEGSPSTPTPSSREDIDLNRVDTPPLLG